DVLHAGRVDAAVQVVPNPEAGGRAAVHPPLVVEEQRVRLVFGSLRRVEDRVVSNQGAAADVVPHRVNDAVADDRRGADDAVAAAALMVGGRHLVGEALV